MENLVQSHVSFLSPRAQLSLEEETITILSHVLDPITFQVDLRLILEPELADVQTDISAKLDRVKGSVSQKDLRVIMGVLRENLTEGAPQPVPGIHLTDLIRICYENRSAFTKFNFCFSLLTAFCAKK